MKISGILKYLDDSKVEYQFCGDKESEINGFSSLKNYKDGSMTWIKKQESADCFDKGNRLALAIASPEIQTELAKSILYVENSKKVFFDIIENFYFTETRGSGIGQGTYISPEVQVEPGVKIGANCTLDGNICIGSGTVIGNNVVIANKVTIGRKCMIQSLSVIGEDGFGFSEDPDGTKTMVKHFGGVTIGDDVFIGSHVNIARGTIDDTVIESGVKIAPSTHIGHNNQIGKNSTIICSNIYGSIEIGENAYITASTVKNQSKIGDRALVGMGSVVTKDVEAGKVVVGAPAKVLRDNR